jgi:hypothetical protein
MITIIIPKLNKSLTLNSNAIKTHFFSILYLKSSECIYYSHKALHIKYPEFIVLHQNILYLLHKQQAFNMFSK